jgi:hypothetical protein
VLGKKEIICQAERSLFFRGGGWRFGPVIAPVRECAELEGTNIRFETKNIVILDILCYTLVKVVRSGIHFP